MGGEGGAWGMGEKEAFYRAFFSFLSSRVYILWEQLVQPLNMPGWITADLKKQRPLRIVLC